MKLWSLYSNHDELFTPISFRPGLNVVFAQVQDPTAVARDSHNLGKTFLISVIDFTLLGDIDAEHPFRAQPELFGGFTFCIQLQSHTGKYITVCRQVKPRQPVQIYVSAEPTARLQDLPSERATPLSLARARQMLDELLGLEVVAPYSYRKGLGYLLRTQLDYSDEFQISKFARGLHKDWKPFVAQILGFDPNPMQRKYEVDEEIERLETLLRTLERQAASRSGEYSEIQGMIQIRDAELVRLRDELDAFSFKEMEADVNEVMVHDVEVQLAHLNERRYALDYEVQEISRSLESEFEFDLDRIRRLFDEAQAELSERLVHQYEELVEFNRRLSVGRKQRLTALRDALGAQRAQMETKIAALDAERQRAMASLLERETLEKYKRLHAYLREARGGAGGSQAAPRSS